MAKITIFGLAGTGTTSAGKMLAEKLGYQFVSSGHMFREMAKENGMSLNEFEEATNKDPKYDNELDQWIKKFGEENNNFVVESRLAWHFIPDSIKIKLICDFDERIKRVAAREKISFDEAMEHNEFRDKKIAERYAKYYGIKDFADDKFDLVIDTTTTSIEETAEKIAAISKSNPSDRSIE
ncbi:hypothetical protein A3I27_01190 [Candidatus Giovannonibacteria bacterium RIFCSPLOWO2_02_FULL_43_11b]|nr:MAG: hypothetical protein A2739_02940 [Candidatus Giovannonibacteria bacterium RIFCSPHIGHO2_01_FULL_43_100]OGF67125.1 MAG: hypothetical protein A3B97_04300 [Candidatus Giovannonibacteria bacterium RIFCSPHIGHO2_02_FULL_43_32]OGF79323.1 MAG: hypothetical protein A3A15_01645 [Candidatus Giovannonibacteria bacterium RIFCSPLOWO2_01_FULL_43_60]OGF90597.1 MAG: hypothetical protein A3I27_01190 [Candidatus Giovannonibacteria bacterium RIFCSPLOWO2_02_FULL_43_11b]OGF91940.1 MAG: hypothetical protein A3